MKRTGPPRTAAASLVALLVGSSSVLIAQDTYYVLMAHDDEAKEILLSVHNPTDQSQSFDLLPIAYETDGTQRSGSATSMSVPAGRTLQYRNLAGNDPSMVELVAHGELTFQAYTLPTDSSGRRVGLREQIPIVASANMIPGGTWAFVSGLRRDSRDRSDYAILNLSHTANTCEHRVRGHDGNWARESHVVNHRPLSLHYVTDVLKVVGIELGDHYTISTNCADNFYVAGLIANDDADRLTVLQPFQSRTSALRPPGHGEPPPPTPNPDTPPVTECPAGRVCFDLPGEFHRATSQRPGFGQRLAVPPGVYTRATFRFRLYHGGWGEAPSKRHLLFWFARSLHNDLFGFGQVRGPGGPPQVFFRSDFDVVAADKQRVTRSLLMRRGETYDIVFDFDTANARIVLSMTDSTGAEVLRSVGRPNIPEIHFGPGHVLRTAFGFPGNEWESPGLGWVWSDLHIELLPKATRQ